MHSRYFLSRTPSEPRASVLPDASDRQLPVGFADVRSDAPLPADERQRAPFGFAPPEPRFVTELSFRRTPRPRPEPVRAVSQQGDAQGSLPVGHASGWRPVDEPAEPQVTDPAPTTEVEPAPATPRAEERFEEQVPFYKREITFRRKRSDEPARPIEPVEPVEQVYEDEPVGETDESAEPFELAEPEEQRVPFYKRELSLRRRKQILEHSGAPGEDPVDDESPLLAEPSLPFGFAVPSPGEPAERDHDEPQPVSDEPVLEPVTAAARANDDADDAVQETDEASTDADGDALAEDAEVVAEADESPDADGRGSEPDIVAESDALAEDDEALDEHEQPAVADEPEAVVEGDLAAAPEELVAAAAASDPIGAAEPFEVAAGVGGDFDFGALEAMHDEFDDEPVPVANGKRRTLRGRGNGRASAPKVSAPKGGRGGRRIVGLKIGASQLAAAVVTRENGEEKLLQLARTPLEPGVVVDGEVRDAPALQAALKAFFDSNRLPRRDVRIGVASNRIGVRTVDLSGIDDDERFGNAVRFKAHEVLPVSFSESVLDYRVVEERVSETGEVTKRVLLVVAPKDQVEPFRKEIESFKSASEFSATPMLRGRIVKLNGVPVTEAKIAADSRWAVDGDRGVTYAREAPKDTRVVEGPDWWPADYSGPPLLSFDADLAEGMGLKIGDTMTLNILGRDIEARIFNLRDVDFRTGGINFLNIMSPGIIDQAPHSFLATVRADAGDEEAMFAAVSRAFPNVTVVRVKETLAQVGEMLGALARGVSVASLITILAGVLVLAGAIAAGHRARLYDAVVMKVLGATRARLGAVYAIEYGLLGTIAGLAALGAGTTSAWAVAYFVLDIPFVFAARAVAVTIAGGALGTLVLGLAGGFAALSAKPASRLRNP